MADPTSVKVAVRIRPLADYELGKGCKNLIDVIPENEQIVVNNTTPYTFNYVFDTHSTQEEVYNRCVGDTIQDLFKGYNMTILAYGQTGSGKTHSMGTAYKGEGDMGVIPRAINDIFLYVNDNFAIDFTITVSFIELYQEVLYDLLSDKSRDQCVLDIREDTKGIIIPNMTEVRVTNAAEVMATLAKGSLGRATASTNMNSQSSRSHAILTLTICMQSKEDPSNNKIAKLHLVDLAGSERPKKTGAVGNTFKEGVNINKGLMVLGNVISALGDQKNKAKHVPYRDSNLTRLLKDSLGGNSITLMIACVSPADYNLEETISTLRYADRAKKIKNKPIVNQDARVAEINDLKKTIQNLRLQIVGQGGAVMCPEELENLKKKLMEAEHKNRELNFQLSTTLVEKTSVLEKNLILQGAIEKLSAKLQELGADFELTIMNISVGLEKNDPEIIQNNLKRLNEIQNKFVEIDSDHKTVETEIKNHDETFYKHLFSPPGSNDENLNESGNERMHELQNAHMHKQMALNSELQEVTKELVMKETLAKKLISNAQHFVDYASMQQNEEKIAALVQEKEDLLQQLKNAHTQENSAKLSEQRRKRMKELEGQISELNKKVSEQARLIKIREKDEIKIKKLNVEISGMKQQKVKLIRNMREENDKFKAWKHQREREVAKLKHEDRKKGVEIAKFKETIAKQQKVLKRKVEEATALKKRLHISLQLRKQAQDMRAKGGGKNSNWLKQEFDVFINLTEAMQAVDHLLEDRGKMQEQLDALKSAEESAEDSEAVQLLKEEIECRSAQIQDLQQKILESDDDNKAKARFDSIQTVGEAKTIIQFLWDQAAEIKKQGVHDHYKLAELQEALQQARVNRKNYEANMKSMEDKYTNELNVLQEAHEEKIAYLLANLRGEQGGDDKCMIIELADKNTQLEQEMETMKAEMERLKEINEKIQEIGVKSKNKFLALPKNPAIQRLIDEDDEKENDDLDTSDIIDDDPKDPDWRKTPLGKRVLQEKRRITYLKKLSFNDDDKNDSGALKRTSKGGCSCKTNCNTKCGCRRMSRECGSTCKCNPENCQNAQGSSKMETDQPEENESFKKPKLDAPKKNGKKLFQLD